MSVKLFGLIFFIWVICMFLGSTLEFRSSTVEVGQDYTAGNATFEFGNATVTGGGTLWVVGMEGGLIKHNADDVWCKIIDVVNNTELTLANGYPRLGGAAAGYTMTTSEAWGGESNTSTLDFLLNYKNALSYEQLWGVIPLPMPNKEYFDTWFEVITLRFDFLQGTGYQMFYWIILAPVAIMGVLSFIMLLIGIIRGNISFG